MQGETRPEFDEDAASAVETKYAPQSVAEGRRSIGPTGMFQVLDGTGCLAL